MRRRELTYNLRALVLFVRDDNELFAVVTPRVGNRRTVKRIDAIAKFMTQESKDHFKEFGRLMAVPTSNLCPDHL